MNSSTIYNYVQVGYYISMDRVQVIEYYHLGYSEEEISEQMDLDSEDKKEVRRIINSLERE